MFLLIIHIIFSTGGLLGLLAGSIKSIFQPLHTSKEKSGLTQRNLSDSSQNSAPAKSDTFLKSFLDWGLFMYTIGVILGAFWAYASYNAFWVWDSKEIMSLVTIFFYFLALSQEKKGNRGKLKILAVLGACSAIFTLIIPTFTLSYHDFLF